MSWAVAVAGRVDPGALLLLFDDREYAESIARDIRSRGTLVNVVRYSGDALPVRPVRNGRPKPTPAR